MYNETSTSGRAGIGHGSASRNVAIARLVIGLLQGLILWALYRANEGVGGQSVWPANVPTLFGPLVLISTYLPIVLLAGVGRLRLRTLAVWSVAAAVVLGLLALHDVVRASNVTDAFGSFVILPFSAAALFIAHHLIVPADRERRWIAPYHAYFDTAWMAGVQLVLSIGFTGAFWLLLFLGAALFNVIGLSFLGDLITKPWFALPLTGLAFATAVQLTDVRDGLIRGVRTVALMLLSWLLLVLTVLVAGFLAALPFTGLTGLWETGSATALVLSAAGALIILINTAYQDGRPDNLPPVVLRVAVRVASGLLTPLIVIAVWGLSLRIGQHGLTPDRIIACACALVGAAYAIGYGLAALVPLIRRGSTWMKALEPTNIAVAVLTVGVILALFSPLADPARLSVADQVKRLESGKVTINQFDFDFLRFDSGKAGLAALAKLSASQDEAIAGQARLAQRRSGPVLPRDAEVKDRVPIIEVWPAGSELPKDFIVAVSLSDPRHGCKTTTDCLATAIDLDGDGAKEILLANEYNVDLFVAGPDGAWRNEGSYRPLNCDREPKVEDPRAAMRAGRLRPIASRWPDLSFGDTPAQLNDNLRCLREDAAH